MIGEHNLTGQCEHGTQRIYKLFKVAIAQQPLELEMIFLSLDIFI